MDLKTGRMYESYEAAIAAGVNPADLVEVEHDAPVFRREPVKADGKGPHQSVREIERRLKRMAVATLVALLLLPATLGAQARTMSPSTDLLTDVITTVSSEAKKPITVPRTYQAFGATTAGAGAATIVIEVSNIQTPQTDADWILMGTITLTLGTTRTTDGFTSFAAWTNVRARVTAISGTNATVSVRMGN